MDTEHLFLVFFLLGVANLVVARLVRPLAKGTTYVVATKQDLWRIVRLGTIGGGVLGLLISAILLIVSL